MTCTLVTYRKHENNAFLWLFLKYEIYKFRSRATQLIYSYMDITVLHEDVRKDIPSPTLALLQQK
jgi:hypothetical protein